jgi:hypothetical protein
LGLCEAGLVNGVPSGNHGSPSEHVNGQYAVNAYHLLKANPKLASDTKALWNAIPDRTATHENGQLDVLLMMYAAGNQIAQRPRDFSLFLSPVAFLFSSHASLASSKLAACASCEQPEPRYGIGCVAKHVSGYPAIGRNQCCELVYH